MILIRKVSSFGEGGSFVHNPIREMSSVQGVGWVGEGGGQSLVVILYSVSLAEGECSGCPPLGGVSF